MFYVLLPYLLSFAGRNGIMAKKAPTIVQVSDANVPSIVLSSHAAVRAQPYKYCCVHVQDGRHLRRQVVLAERHYFLDWNYNNIGQRIRKQINALIHIYFSFFGIISRLAKLVLMRFSETYLQC